MGILNRTIKILSIYFEQIASRIELNTLRKSVASNYDPMTKMLSNQSMNESFLITLKIKLIIIIYHQAYDFLGSNFYWLTVVPNLTVQPNVNYVIHNLQKWI